jgi:hypothetical protein
MREGVREKTKAFLDRNIRAFAVYSATLTNWKASRLPAPTVMGVYSLSFRVSCCSVGTEDVNRERAEQESTVSHHSSEQHLYVRLSVKKIAATHGTYSPLNLEMMLLQRTREYSKFSATSTPFLHAAAVASQFK